MDIRETLIDLDFENYLKENRPYTYLKLKFEMKLYTKSINGGSDETQADRQNEQTKEDFKCAKEYLYDLPRCKEKCNECFYISE